MTLGERIVFYRRRQNLTQKALAGLMGISPTRLNYWEKDKREPDVRMINQLCRVLDVDPKFLLSDAEVPEEETLPSSKLRIKEARMRAGLTQRQLSDELGIAVTTLSGYETGRSDPKTEHLVPISQICGVTVDFLLGLDEKETPPGPAEPDQRERGRVEVSTEALERMLQREGFIQPGEDLSDADLRFLFGVGEVISAWFGKSQQGGRK